MKPKLYLLIIIILFPFHIALCQCHDSVRIVVHSSNSDFSGWEDDSKTVSHFNVNGTVSYVDRYMFTNGMLSLNQRTSYSYDANGNTVEILIQNYTLAGWRNFSMTSFTFSSTGKITSEILKSWINFTWIITSREFFTYNSADSLTERYDQYYDGVSWINSSRDLYFYDNFNFDTLHVSQRGILSG